MLSEYKPNTEYFGKEKHFNKNDIYFIHIYYTQLQNMTNVPNHKKVYKSYLSEQVMLMAAVKTYIFLWCKEKVCCGADKRVDSANEF